MNWKANVVCVYLMSLYNRENGHMLPGTFVYSCIYCRVKCTFTYISVKWVCKKDGRSSYLCHREICLVSLASKLPVGVDLPQLPTAHEWWVPQNQIRCDQSGTMSKMTGSRKGSHRKHLWVGWFVSQLALVAKSKAFAHLVTIRLHFDVVGRFACHHDPKIYAGWLVSNRRSDSTWKANG